jgi:hypothetical protein
MIERRGTVFIAPAASYVPSGRMVDPQGSIFYVSWQDWPEESQGDELVEDGGEITGADKAIAWGRARCDRVLIRLGHTDETHFSAGDVPLSEQMDGRGRPYPLWPPERVPAEGWWTPEDEEAAWEQAVENARRSEPRLPAGEPPPGPWTGGY